ncbi:uncharacterized protein [Amphiura filiformis]|uniref:uncharacterized protein n=1 Tax=Amphiura filiformis TaxID=82378 RepID=UPI003B22074C
MAQPEVLFLIITAIFASTYLIAYTAASNDYDESSQTSGSCSQEETATRCKPIESPCGCFMGPSGPAGATGAPGTVGPSGLPGVQGPQGLTGSIGPKGDPGLEGQVGLKGSTGESGTAGQNGVNGEKGEAGQDGANGARGLKGTKGLKGDSGEKGDEGDVGPGGHKGDSGTKGDKGDTGKGTKGDAGTPYVPPPLSMFTATLTSSLHVSSGYQTVAFNSVKMNAGNDYSATSGFFTCRIPGMYSFSVTVLSHPQYDLNIYLMRNEVQEARAYYNYMSDKSGYSTIGHSIVLDLEEGDEIYIRAHPTTYLYASGTGSNVFTGHLLYAAADMSVENEATEI